MFVFQARGSADVPHRQPGGRRPRSAQGESSGARVGGAGENVIHALIQVARGEWAWPPGATVARPACSVRPASGCLRVPPGRRDTSASGTSRKDPGGANPEPTAGREAVCSVACGPVWPSPQHSAVRKASAANIVGILSRVRIVLESNVSSPSHGFAQLECHSMTL